MHMKISYEEPNLKELFVTPAKCVLASGENLTKNRSYENSEDFWD